MFGQGNWDSPPPQELPQDQIRLREIQPEIANRGTPDLRVRAANLRAPAPQNPARQAGLWRSDMSPGLLYRNCGTTGTAEKDHAQRNARWPSTGLPQTFRRLNIQRGRREHWACAKCRGYQPSQASRDSGTSPPAERVGRRQFERQRTSAAA